LGIEYGGKQMTVGELIEELNKFPPKTYVFVWIDGERKDVFEIDDSFLEKHRFIDINIGD
jgi:hypothetical protein